MSDPRMMACTQHALEEYVTEAGRELQRQLMQDQLDARAAREPRLGQVAGADGVVRRRVEAGHRRLVATTVGAVEANRIAYRAPGAPNLHPSDARLALPERLYSFPLQTPPTGDLPFAAHAELSGGRGHRSDRQISARDLRAHASVTAASRALAQHAAAARRRGQTLMSFAMP